MSDTGARLRALFEEIAPAVDIRGAMASRQPVAGPRRDWLIAAAAASAAVLVGLAGWLLVARRGPEAPIITTPPVAGTTTTLAGRGLDGLASFRAGPVPLPATCPPGSTPDVAGDPAAPRPGMASRWFGGDWSAAFDRQSGRLVWVVLDRPRSEGGRFATWTFDPCRNRWQEMGSVGLDPVGFLTHITYDADSDRIVGVDESGTVWVYDTDADVWVARPWAVGKTMLPNDWPAIYDDASGLIVFYDPWPAPGASAWAYDVDTDARYEITPWEVPAGELLLDPMSERFYVFTWDLEPWRWEPGKWWAEVGAPAPSVLRVSPACNFDPYAGLLSVNALAFDAATGRFVFFCAGQAAAAFDPTSLTWEVLDGLGPEAPRDLVDAVYDSANDRLILLGTEMWAYDARTGEWIELLAAAG